MDLTQELHATLLIGALLLAAGALARGTNARANRLFALLCVAVAIWNGGVAGRQAQLAPGFPWWWVILFGALLAVPVGIQLATVLTGERGAVRRVVVPASYVTCLLLWLTVLHPLTDRYWDEWRIGALLLLAGLLSVALWVLWRHLRTLTHEPERGAFRLLFGGSVVAVVGGLSDLIPRGAGALPRIGPAAVLLLLLVLCALVVRQDFFDVDTFLARMVAIVLGAAAATALIFTTQQLTGARPFPLFVTMLLLIGASLPLARVLLERPLGLLAPGGSVAQGLAAASARLLVARDPGEAWRAIEAGRRVLPGETRLAIYLPGQEERLARAAAGAQLVLAAAAQGEPVLAWLRGASGPAPRSTLLRAVGETPPGNGPARAALDALDALDLDLVLPLARGTQPAGWFALGGGRREEYLRPEVATALLALGNQATASFDRLAAESRERRQAALAALGEVAAGLAHEIRNPVAAVRGAADVLGGVTSDEQAREMLDVIREESRRLGRVLEEFSDYARPAEPRMQPVDVVALVRATVREAELAGFGMRTSVSGAAVGAVVADPDLLRRAFANLVRNAREAAGPEGHLAISVRPAGDRLAIRFEDDGPGLPPGNPAELFEPFRTTKPGGLGLGLALVQRVADAHHGEIRVERLPRGTAFTMLLPAGEQGAGP